MKVVVSVQFTLTVTRTVELPVLVKRIKGNEQAIADWVTANTDQWSNSANIDDLEYEAMSIADARGREIYDSNFGVQS